MENLKIESDRLNEALAQERVFASCTFYNCDLSGLDIRGKEFSACIFDHCNLSLTKFINSAFSEAVFKDSKLVGIDFTALRRPTLFRPFIRFQDCLMELCNFSGLNLKETVFKSCSVFRCTFGLADMTQADFENSDLEGSAFHHTNLTLADLTRARNYAIDATANTLKKAKFSIPEALSLLRGFDIDIFNSK